MSDPLREAASKMREEHGPDHPRHEMWAAMADWLDHTAVSCGLNRAPYVQESHVIAHEVAAAYMDAPR